MDPVDHPWLEIDENSPWDVVFIVGLVEKHIFPIASVDDVVMQQPVLRNAMFCYKLLPKLVPCAT